jgi:hypothetical protein
VEGDGSEEEVLGTNEGDWGGGEEDGDNTTVFLDIQND